jgi:hypothetical protein
MRDVQVDEFPDASLTVKVTALLPKLEHVKICEAAPFTRKDETLQLSAEPLLSTAPVKVACPLASRLML